MSKKRQEEAFSMAASAIDLAEAADRIEAQLRAYPVHEAEIILQAVLRAVEARRFKPDL